MSPLGVIKHLKIGKGVLIFYFTDHKLSNSSLEEIFRKTALAFCGKIEGKSNVTVL